MEKRKFSWDLFTKFEENIIVRDTKENEKVFLQMAEKEGLEVDWERFYEVKEGYHCYFSYYHGNLVSMGNSEGYSKDEIYTLEEVFDGLGLKLEDGDIVQIRKRAICVVINGYILDFNKKEIVSKVEEYDLSLNDRDNLRSLDIIKVAKKDTLVPYNYIAPSEEYVEWIWKREVGIPSDLCNGTRIKAYDTETGEIYTGTITTLDVDENTVKILITESGINKNTKCVLLKKLDLLEVLQ